MENEGLVVIGRALSSEWSDADKVHAVAQTVGAWAKKLSLPQLGLVYCGSTINWPDDVDMSPIVVGLVTYCGVGEEDDNDRAGTVSPAQMDPAQGQAIPPEFWDALRSEHGAEYEGDVDVLLAVAGWTWVRLEAEGEELAVSAEDSGFRRISPEARARPQTMSAGYC